MTLQKAAAQIGRRSFLAGTTTLSIASMAPDAASAGSGSSAGSKQFASADEWIAREKLSREAPASR